MAMPACADATSRCGGNNTTIGQDSADGDHCVRGMHACLRCENSHWNDARDIPRPIGVAATVEKESMFIGNLCPVLFSRCAVPVCRPIDGRLAVHNRQLFYPIFSYFA